MDRAPSILLVGLGGAGCAMVARLAPGLPADLQVLRVDTDARLVDAAGPGAALQVGRAQTRGMGTGGEPAVGAVAAEAEEAALRRAFTGPALVVLVTGLGGGTGSGAAPVVARVAAEAGATVLAFATMPFSHEGERRMRQANEGAIALGQKAHGLVFVHNDLLLQQVSNEAPLSESFAAADAWVGGALRALAAAFEPGALVPVDPAALRSILASPGSPTLFAYGVGGLNDPGFPGYSGRGLWSNPTGTDNVRFSIGATATYTLLSDVTAHTLNVNGGNNPSTSTLDFGGFTLRLQGGGLLFGTSNGNSNAVFQNGTLTAGVVGQPADLYVFHASYGTDARNVTLNTVIADNQAGSPLRLILTTGDGQTGSYRLELGGLNT
ncbi:hypothetical protein EBR16_04970, partial [bacterium]|nr:hypothetical protein [bacterium]